MEGGDGSSTGSAACDQRQRQQWRVHSLLWSSRFAPCHPFPSRHCHPSHCQQHASTVHCAPSLCSPMRRRDSLRSPQWSSSVGEIAAAQGRGSRGRHWPADDQWLTPTGGHRATTRVHQSEEQAHDEQVEGAADKNSTVTVATRAAATARLSFSARQRRPPFHSAPPLVAWAQGWHQNPPPPGVVDGQAEDTLTMQRDPHRAGRRSAGVGGG